MGSHLIRVYIQLIQKMYTQTLNMYFSIATKLWYILYNIFILNGRIQIMSSIIILGFN